MTRVMLVGATRLVGSRVLAQALTHDAVTQLVAPTRRPLATHPKLLNPDVSFHRLPEQAEWWAVDAVICTLGTTIGKAGSKPAFYQVDHDLALRVGQLALAGLCGAHCSAQLFEINRLGEVVERARLERLHRVFGRAVGGDDDALFSSLVGIELAQQLQSQAVGQAHVGDQYIKTLLGQAFASLRQVAGGGYLVTFAQQGEFVQGAQVGFVVDDQHRGGDIHRHSGQLSGS